MKALALMVWDKKIFKLFSFGCHGNQSSSRNSYLWSFLKVHHPKIISVKFHWNLLAGFITEDFLSNCSGRTDGHMAGQMDAGQWSITIAHSEHVVLRWAKKTHEFTTVSLDSTDCSLDSGPILRVKSSVITEIIKNVKVFARHQLRCCWWQQH